MEFRLVLGRGRFLHSALHIKGGRVQESNYHDYRVLRMNEMPVVEVHIVPSTEKPGGIGEVGVPPIAPAVANAVAGLTGQRARELPPTPPTRGGRPAGPDPPTPVGRPLPRR